MRKTRQYCGPPRIRDMQEPAAKNRPADSDNQCNEGDDAVQIGRNDPCPCGSGKKFKKCCIDKPEYQSSEQLPAKSRIKTPGPDLGHLLRHADDLAMANREEESAAVGREIWKHIESRDLTENMFDTLFMPATAQGIDSGDLLNWIADYQDQLHNGMYRNLDRAQTCIDFVDGVLMRFPRLMGENATSLLAAKGDALFLLGQDTLGDALFEALQENNPKDPWPLIWWGDQYSPVFKWSRANDARAEELYRRALSLDPSDEASQGRLADLAYWRDEQKTAQP